MKLANENSVLILPDIEITADRWRRLKFYKDDYDACVRLEEILADELNCNCGENGVQIRHYGDYNYSIAIDDYYRILVRIDDPVLYNEYTDKLINIDAENREYYVANQNAIKSKYAPTTKPKRKKRVKNEFVRNSTTDMFSGKTIYIYDNPYTGECIESEDDNLLETLNAKPKAKKKRRERDVKTINVTFNFNIKKK